MTPLAISLVTKIVVAWVAVSVIVALIFGVMAARLQEGRRLRDRRGIESDRRAGMADRRIGLPDTRENPVERRRGPSDRRARQERRRLRRRPSMA